MKASDVAAFVRDLRRRLRLTQEQFAHRLGVTYSTVNHWENGRRLPQPFLVRRLLALNDETSAEATPATPPALDGAIQTMVDRIVDRFKPDKVILFGSRARGDARPDSDVDLMVVMDIQGSRRKAQLDVRQAVHDVPVSKDVIVTSPEQFERRRSVVGTIERSVSREGTLLYAKP
jgi:predicted nucleotidyltransferase/DNA-binding XRE family transcriptional regulator